jgi:hypothetical protein
VIKKIKRKKMRAAVKIAILNPKKTRQNKNVKKVKRMKEKTMKAVKIILLRKKKMILI